MNSTIKAAIMEVLKASISRENYVSSSTASSPSPRSVRTLWENGIKIEGDTVTQHGKPIYRIIRQYAAKKSEGFYKQLVPKLEPIV